MERSRACSAPFAYCWTMNSAMKKHAKAIMVVAGAQGALVAAMGMTWAGDPAAGNVVFETRCHTCHAALPYTGRVGEANLVAFLKNPRRYNPKTAMTFPGLKSKKDIDDVIAYITGSR
jgi:cytochrome c2